MTKPSDFSESFGGGEWGIRTLFAHDLFVGVPLTREISESNARSDSNRLRVTSGRAPKPATYLVFGCFTVAALAMTSAITCGGDCMLIILGLVKEANIDFTRSA
jgi:hypothetical protein